MTSSRTAKRVAGLIALILLASAGRLLAQEGPVRVEVRGVDAEERRNVLSMLSLATGGERTVLQEARVLRLHSYAEREISMALEPFGRYGVRVEGALAFDGRRWLATYNVTPGPQVHITAVDTRIQTGMDDGAAADAEFQQALRRFPLVVGDPLLHARYEAAKLALESVAAERGYLDAHFDSSVVRVDRGTSSAEVTLHFITGPRFRFGEVTFLQEALDPEILHQMIPFQAGQSFEAAQLLVLQNALATGPYFANVEVLPRRDLADGLSVPIEVHVTPHRPQRYLAGLGYGTDTGPRGTASVEVRRLNRSGHRMDAEIRASLIEQRASTRYSMPLRGAREALLTLSAGFVSAHPTTSDSETFLLGANLARAWRGWRQDLSLTLQRADYEVGLDSGISTLLVLGTGLSRVRADDRIYPTHGTLIGLRIRGSHGSILSDVGFIQVGMEGKVVRSPSARLRVLARAEVGAVYASDFHTLPASARYFAGGDRSLRGFPYQSLGPVDADGHPLGGERLVVGSLEVDYWLKDDWGVALFADAGNALTSFSDALERSAGIGIRWRSPVGPVRLDGAFALSRQGRPFRIHINIGPEL